MKIAYIKENKLGKKIFGGIEIGFFDNNYIISVSNKEKTRVKKRLTKFILKQKIDTLVFSKDLEGEFKEEICALLNDNFGIDVLNGKKLMELMDFDIVKYIIDIQQVDMKQEEIYIIFKKDNSLNLNFLKRFIENFRMTNVVTNDIERLKNVQDNLLEQDGILISVSNNKRKALKRAKYVLNMNLSKTELEKYKINRNAIIINIKENVRYEDVNFDGINVNYFEITLPDEYIEKFEQIGENFDYVKLYESELVKDMQGKSLEDIYTKIKSDEVRVDGLIGNNGKISRNEFGVTILEKIRNKPESLGL